MIVRQYRSGHPVTLRTGTSEMMREIIARTKGLTHESPAR